MKRLNHCAVAAFGVVALLLSASCGRSAQPAPVTSIVVEKKVVEEQPELQVQRPDYHIVSKGETLTSIALNYGLAYRELAFWNNLRDANVINVGQRLRLTSSGNEPVAQPIATQKQPTLSPVVPNGGEVAAPAAGALNRKETTLVGGDDAAPAAAGGNVPFKATPLAKKFIYSPELLKKLRKEWGGKTAVAKPAAANIPKPTPPKKNANAANALASRNRFDITWSWPTTGKIIERFNETSKGVGFDGKVGDAVYAAATGKVVYVGTGVTSYGLLVILKHSNDYLTAYAHNDKVTVKEGETVLRGGQIAALGMSGTTSPMLHFEVRKSGKPFDPMQVLPPQAR